MTPAGPQDPKTRTSDLDRAVGFFHSGEAQPAADARALAALQFGDVLAYVAGFSATDAGAARVRSLTPRSVRRGATTSDARDAIIGEHTRVAAMRALFGGDDPWPSAPIPGVAAALTRLRVAGSTWHGAELRETVTLLVSSRLQAAALRAAQKREAAVAALAPLGAALLTDAGLEALIDKVVDDAGIVRDSASAELRRTRKQLRGAEADLIRLLEKLIGGLESHHRVDDGSVTMRNGRWVIPVRREGRVVVGGIVHDTSATGATVFVEPPAAVEFGNRIRELEYAEIREVERILAETTDAIRPRADELIATLDALIELDAIVARARFADRHRCWPATLQSPADGLAIVDGRHPLLVAQHAGKDADPVVPFTLTLEPAERTLLVSGPNTGGKTVLLKAVALHSLMAQAGIPPTVGPGSALPLYDRVFADIGDEQSIEASLSTFSGHVRNLIEIVEEATPDSLVLADELGSGTDPNEGAALGGAILEALTRRGTTTVATTHLGALKELAHEVPGVVNASLQFDEAALAPTYRLLKGIPGRSYGISIARRLKMPGEILTRAEERVPKGERDAAAMIEELERKQHSLEERARDLASAEEHYAARAERVAEREGQVKSRERELEREARSASKRYVLEARKEIEAAIADLRRASESGGRVDSAAAEARGLAERALQRERTELQKLEADGADEAEQRDSSEALVVGDFVSVPNLGGAAAQVIEARGGDLVVVLGSVRTTVPRAAARKVRAPRRGRDGSLRPGASPAIAEPVAVMGKVPEVAAKFEVDLRGMRIGEVDGAVQLALDGAVLGDLPSIRIIHGKGTGALRERVGELLREDSRVKSFRLGAWNEGGAGVTVAEFA